MTDDDDDDFDSDDDGAEGGQDGDGPESHDNDDDEQEKRNALCFGRVSYGITRTPLQCRGFGGVSCTGGAHRSVITSEVMLTAV